MVPDWSLTIAVDLNQLPRLYLTAQTWKNRQELYRVPMLAFCDGVESAGWWRRHICNMTGHPNVNIILWPEFPGVDQRWRMLAAFTWGVAEFCETPWHLKLDLDCCCMPSEKKWPEPEWFSDEKGFVFISKKWGYTKPAETFIELQRWARTVPVFDGKPEAPGVWEDPLGKCKHHRIISFHYMARTSFVREVASLANPPGPIPSHDTLHWYVANRLGYPYLRIRDVGQYGFSHGARKLRERCLKAMDGQNGTHC